MSNMVKSKFAGLFRGLLGRKDREQLPVETEMEQRPVTAAAPDYPASAQGEFAPPSGTGGAQAVGENEIALSLSSILSALPLDLRAKIVSVPQPGAVIRISVDTVIEQLAFGAVKISFGELRQMAAGVFSNSSSSELDSRPVSLPLNEILPRINPALLARHNSEKVEVDEEIKGPFAGRGRGVAFTTEPLKEPKSASRPGPARSVPPRAATPAVPHANPPEAMPSTPIPFRPVTPAASASQAKTPFVNRPPITPITSIGSYGTNGSNGSNGNGSNGHHSQHQPIVPLTPKHSPAPAPVPAAPTPAPAAARVEPAQPTIFAGLWDLAENWPDELKEEISRSDIANANLPIPGAFAETGLRRGRLTMTWKQIRLLAKPSSIPSPNDGLELELPLKVITPLFFAAKKAVPAVKKSVNVSSEIPNLFFGFPQAAPEMPVPAPKPATQHLARRPLPRPAEAPAPAPIPTAQASVFQPNKQSNNTNFYVWGDDGEVPQEENDFNPPPVPQTDFTSRRAMPKDIVEKAVSFRGVAGALITLPDGLRVASNVPVEFNADTLAAFIPQIFERMNQSARELRMGALNNVSFTVGNIPWRIFRVNSVYLAAFGRAGESLPAADLSALAGELDRKK